MSTKFMRTKVTKQAFGLYEVCKARDSFVDTGTIFLLFQLKRRDNKKITQRRQAPRVLSSPEYEGA